jgi:putative hydrolase of the HAD superfamily
LRDCFGVKGTCEEETSAPVFFSVFRQKLRCCPGATELLRALKARGRPVGVYTDVPYGMPTELVEDDLRESGLLPLINVLLTSRQTEFRKPAVQTLRTLAERLGCTAENMVYVGNERKDVDVALAFGCEAVLLDRAGAAPVWGQRRTIRSLQELLANL